MGITSGEATKQYIVEAVEHVLLRQGTIGVRVTIMLPHDPEGNKGVKEQLPDRVGQQYEDAEYAQRPMEQQPYGGQQQNYDQQQGYAQGYPTQGGPPQQQYQGYGQQQAPPQQYGGPTPGYGQEARV